MHASKLRQIATLCMLALGCTASSATAASFTVEPLTVHGEQTTEHVFTLAESTAKCKKASFAAEIKETTSTLEVTPTYSECTASTLPATVFFNGCKYVLGEPTKVEGGYTGTADLTCPEGKVVEIKAYLGSTHSTQVCNYWIFPSTGITGHLIYKNTEGQPKDVLTEVTLESLEYEGHGGICPDHLMKTSIGAYHGSSTLETTTAAGNQVGFHVG